MKELDIKFGRKPSNEEMINKLHEYEIELLKKQYDYSFLNKKRSIRDSLYEKG